MNTPDPGSPGKGYTAVEAEPSAPEAVSVAEATAVVRRRQTRNLLASFLVFVITLALLALAANTYRRNRDIQTTIPIPSGKHYTGCVTPYGTKIGTAFGVPSFSNCNGSFTSNTAAYVKVKTNPILPDSPMQTIYSGMQWQCVEYGRRFLMRTRRVAFGSVVGAADIWKLDVVHDIIDNKRQYEFYAFPNGATNEVPVIGDLLIYPVQPGGFPFGHVTAVVNVTDTEVHIAEQNWDQKFWKHPTYSRALRLERSLSGSIVVADPGNYTIVGWKRADVK